MAAKAAEREIEAAKEEAKELAELGLTSAQQEEVAGLIKDVMEAYDVSLEDAKKALVVPWSSRWCPVLPSMFRGKASSLCEIRESLSDLATSVGLDLESLLEVVSKEDLA